MAPLRALGPEIDTIAMVPPVALSEMHMDPPDPLPYAGEGYLLGGFPRTAIDELVAAAGPGSGSNLISVEVRHLGGALGRGGEGHGALDRFRGAFLSFSVGMADDDGSAAATRESLHRVDAVLRPHRSETTYLNFEEEPADPAIFYGVETYRRLREIKAAVDPEELILSNHPIPPAEA